MFQTPEGTTISVPPSAPSSSNQQPTFSVGTGNVTTDLGTDDRGNSVLVQIDGKILVGGVTSKGGFSYYTLSRYNSDGSLDTSFNGNGTVLTNTPAIPAEKTALFALADGKILFGGFSMTRVTSDGKIDNTFFSSGRPTDMVVYNASLQENGKILLVGSRSVNSTTNSVVVRLNADGTIDNTFNGNGILELNLGNLDFAKAVVSLPNQKSLIVTYVDLQTNILRLNSDGSLDKTFGINGKIEFGIDGWAISDAIALQSNGKIVVTGQWRDDAFVARFNENGSVDTTFNGTGYKSLGIGIGAENFAIDIQADGKIITTGQIAFDTKKFVAARFNTDGTLDTSFNGTGKLILEGDFLAGSGVDIQSNGKIVFSTTKNSDLALVRTNADGSPDKTFNAINSVNANVTYTGGSNPTILDNDAKVYDADLALNNRYSNSSLILERVGGAHSSDVFGGSGTLKLEDHQVFVQGINIGNYDMVNGRLQINFTGNATQDLVNASLQQINYKNSNSHLNKNVSIRWTFDDGSGASNSTVSSTSIVAVNSIPNLHVPSSSDRSITGLEDVAYTFKVSDFAFVDADATDSLQAIIITGLPTAGTLFLKGVNGAASHAVDIADTIDVNDIYAGRLQFQGALNANGNNYSSFRIKVSDGADTSSSATISVNLTPVNDLPVGEVTISGKYTVAQTLNAANTLVDVDGIGPITYQWKANGVTIEGASSSSLVLSDAMAGKSISVLAQYTDAGGTRESVSSQSTKIIGKNYVGTEKNDQFSSQAEDETFYGGAGIDTVSYRGNLSFYTIQKDGNSYTVSSKFGSDGTDTLTGIETIKFADVNVNLTIQNQAAASPAADVQKLIELYISFFNRIPDANGLSYWIGELQAGKKINQIAESFYGAGVQYTSLTGFSATMSDGDFINTIYKNTLGRTDGADADGLNYWKAELSSGRATHGSLVSTILNSAHSFKGNAQWGFVADLLDNKIAVGKTVAIDWGISFNSDVDSISKGMAIAAAVTSSSTSIALELVGINAHDISLI